MRLKQAILEFLANELHLETSAITEETSFTELAIDATQLTDLLSRLQESLGIILPEDKVPTITTVGDLLDLVDDPHDLE